MNLNTKTKFHRDNTVTVWNVYTQQWERGRAESVPAEVLASLPAAERERIQRVAAKAA